MKTNPVRLLARACPGKAGARRAFIVDRTELRAPGHIGARRFDSGQRKLPDTHHNLNEGLGQQIEFPVGKLVVHPSVLPLTVFGRAYDQTADFVLDSDDNRFACHRRLDTPPAMAKY